MEWIDLGKAAILGIVEGATEFLPISSTGHLILVGDWLDFEGARAATFDVFIQLGAILAVVWIYRTKILKTFGGWKNPDDRRLLINLFVAFLPAAIVGFFLHDWIEEKLFNPIVVAFALVIGGVVILLVEKFRPPPRVETVNETPTPTALGVGLAQLLSLIPGVSRSGATIMGGLSLGMSRVAATEFSFFLAIPIMFAATFYTLAKSMGELQASDAPVFAVGFIVSFISALIIVKQFIRFVSSNTFKPFAWYRIIFGCLLLAWYLKGG